MSNIYQNIQLDRIATAIENGDAGGGTLTINLTGVGDMQPATASTAGAHGLVPAPQAGDNDKVLSGAGTWIHAGAGVDYSLTEQDTGLKWIDGKNVYQQSIEAINPTSASVIFPLVVDTLISIEWTAYDITNNQWVTSNVITDTYMIAVYLYQGGVYLEYRGTSNIKLYATIKYTKS